MTIKHPLKITLPLAFLTVFTAGCAVQTEHDNFCAPSTLSKEMALSVNAKTPPLWQTVPQSMDEWHTLADNFAKAGAANATALAQKYNVDISEGKIGGVRTFTLTPSKVDVDKKDKVILYIHGGGYVLGQGVGGTAEAIYLAGLHNYKIVCVDYRMAPDYPFPAAIEDSFTVYKELIKEYGAENIAVFGTSTGGAMTFILSLQAHDAEIAQPGALVSGTPWADLDKIGDSYFVNDGVDNILGNYDHLIKSAAKAYANGADLKDPFISPVYASDEALRDFPPTLLISGTRDLFLSNTVRMHKRLLLNDVNTDLVVYEALSHAQYYLNSSAPETFEHYEIVDKFLEKNFIKK
ncbi:alpha/beta hydrolase [Succinatimonas hippei]|uniref:alpha/beta hydrolase n=1 Tax=Succinatimonas hippei TaxID=626938 RepID=UPI0026EAA6F8|nr:alpha/beta hydrolase [Succinatimonas hippei]